MRVLHIISTLSPRYGGPVTVVRQLARHQVMASHDVTICTTNTDYPHGILPVPADAPVGEQGVTIRYFETQFSPLLLSIPMARWLKGNIDRFDVVHVHGLYRFPPTFAAWCARKAGVPYLIRPHGSLDPFLYRQSSRSLSFKRLYECLFDLPNLNHASAIHYTTTDEMERAAFLGFRAPGVVVPNGLDWEAYTRLPPSGKFRQRIGIEQNTPLVLFLGRINFKKGLDLLVPAFARVLRDIPDARLAIVGPDNEGLGRDVRRWCHEQGIRDKVIFVDHLDAEEVKEAYVDADVFVLPSYTENFGMTVVEAMACGCPVVISDQVNIWREVQQACAGLVVGLDAQAIAEALVMVLRDNETARQMGKAGRALTEQKYAWPKIVAELTQVYESLTTQ